MTSRTQVSLDPQLHRRARRRAAELGISFAEYVRRLVSRDLGEQVRRAEPAAVFDLGSSGGADIVREKDRLIGEAVAREVKNQRRKKQ
jgi:hypothetical protein